MNLFSVKNDSILIQFNALIADINLFDADSKIDIINRMKVALHEISPFKDEPVDCVLWVKNENVGSNDYNPNAVAPPEMALLELSILEDGYTQPIVGYNQSGAIASAIDGHHIEVVDGFHRNRVGKECLSVRSRVLGYLPIVQIQTSRSDKSDRMAATVRHNRARGKHNVDSMSDIVLELKRRNWSDEKIGKELGMDPDEVLRLAQITGLAEMFKDKDFSMAWVAERFEDIEIEEPVL